MQQHNLQGKRLLSPRATDSVSVHPALVEGQAGSGGDFQRRNLGDQWQGNECNKNPQDADCEAWAGNTFWRAHMEYRHTHHEGGVPVAIVLERASWTSWRSNN